MYQFIHIESYGKVSAKKKLNYNNETKGRNVSDIIGEVTRKKGYCDHVEQPEEPVVLYGINPEELEVLTDNYFNNTKLTNNKGISRGLRKDSHVLLAGVISLNRECEGFWEDYKNDSINWLKEKYGDKLKCVVEHKDESHPHIHFYCVQNPGEDFDLIHEGKRAFKKEEKKYKKEIAFKEEMRIFQENFFSNVSAKYGLMKTGPKRKRLTNEEYKRQQQEIRLINLHREKTFSEMEELIKKTEEDIKNQKSKARSEIILLKQKTIATATKDGENKGFSFAINEFNNKSYFNKIFFSRSFINDMENENKNLKLKVKDLHVRGEDLKDKYNRLLKRKKIYKNKVIYNDLITDFINDEKPQQQKEIENDIRRKIIGEIKAIEDQQQFINSRNKTIRTGHDRNREKVNNYGEKLGRSFRVLFSNVRNFIGDFLAVKLFKRMLEDKGGDGGKIEKFKPKERKTEDLKHKTDHRPTIGKTK